MLFTNLFKIYTSLLHLNSPIVMIIEKIKWVVVGRGRQT